MLGGGCLVGAAQEQARDREAAVPFAFLNPRLLKQVQGTATGTEEHELRVNRQRLFLIDAVFSLNSPRTIGFAGHISHLVAVAHLNTVGLQVIHHALGEGTEINIGAFGCPRGGNWFVCGSARNGQRRPFSDLIPLG